MARSKTVHQAASCILRSRWCECRFAFFSALLNLSHAQGLFVAVKVCTCAFPLCTLPTFAQDRYILAVRVTSALTQMASVMPTNASLEACSFRPDGRRAVNVRRLKDPTLRIHIPRQTMSTWCYTSSHATHDFVGPHTLLCRWWKEFEWEFENKSHE